MHCGLQLLINLLMLRLQVYVHCGLFIVLPKYPYTGHFLSLLPDDFNLLTYINKYLMYVVHNNML